jgi:hypothetical protein
VLIIACMTKEEAVKYFGTQSELARALSISQASIAGWGDEPPELRQLQLHRMTRGKLRASISVIEKYGEPRTYRSRAA